MLADTIATLQSHLTPDLLAPAWRQRVAVSRRTPHLHTGHCYVASEAAYHLFARDLGYSPRVARIGAVTHWWLEAPDGLRLDLTAAQFTPAVLDRLYARGRGCGFLTRRPSRRARTLMQLTCQ